MLLQFQCLVKSNLPETNWNNIPEMTEEIVVDHVYQCDQSHVLLSVCCDIRSVWCCSHWTKPLKNSFFSTPLSPPQPAHPPSSMPQTQLTRSNFISIANENPGVLTGTLLLPQDVEPPQSQFETMCTPTPPSFLLSFFILLFLFYVFISPLHSCKLMRSLQHCLKEYESNANKWGGELPAWFSLCFAV